MAGRLFDAEPGCGGVVDLTMARLAQEAGLAKGTLYLYFATKEEIFLALVLDELRLWTDELMAELQALPDPDPERVAQRLAQTLSAHTRLLRLLGILHPILERNLSPQALLAFKLDLVCLLDGPAAGLEAHLPGLGPGDGARFFRRLHAIVIGLALSSRPSPAVAALLDRPELTALRVDFAAELRAIVAALLRGWSSPDGAHT